MVSPSSIKNIDYIDSVKEIQNTQIEMMQLLLDVKNEILCIRHELSNKSKNSDKPAEIRDSHDKVRRSSCQSLLRPCWKDIDNDISTNSKGSESDSLSSSDEMEMPPDLFGASQAISLHSHDLRGAFEHATPSEKETITNRESMCFRKSLGSHNKHMQKSLRKLNYSQNESILYATGSNLSFALLPESKMGSFRTFAIASMDKIIDVSEHVMDWGNNDLCSIILGPGSGCIRYKFSPTDEKLKVHELVPFCFPHGLKIRIIPRFAVDGAKRLGWLGDEADEYQLHAFHNASGERTNGISITVKREVDSSYFEMLKAHRLEHRAAIKILTFLRYCCEKMKRKINRTSGGFLDSIWVRKESDVAQFKSHLDLSNKGSKNVLMKVSWQSQKLASESYQAMLDNSTQDYVFIIEQCYTILGTDPDTHSLMFSALQILIDSERNSMFKDCAKTFDDRHHFLQQLHSNMKLSPNEAKVCHPLSELEQVSRNREAYKIEFKHFPEIPYYLPLPQMSSEWGLAQLLFKFNLRTVIDVLMLLLLEHSVLVIGDSYEEVSSCSFTLLDLLKPYKWASVFIPMLPEEMIEFISSPVPYVVGVVARDKAHLKEIEADSLVKQEIQHGLSVINITSGNIQWTQESHIKEKRLTKASHIISHAYGDDKLITQYDQRIEQLAKNVSSSLYSFKLFFQNGASPKESVTLNSIKRFIEKSFIMFSGIISQRNDGYLMCSEHDDFSDELTFSATKFHTPLIRLLEFQRYFSKTQLLSCYYEEKHNKSESKQFDKVSALFIADWVYFHWRKFQQVNQS